MSKFRNNSPTFLKENYLDKNISITSLKPAPKIWDSQVHQYHNVTTLGTKSERAQYEKGQQGGEDRKGKKSGKDGEGERNRESH